MRDSISKFGKSLVIQEMIIVGGSIRTGVSLVLDVCTRSLSTGVFIVTEVDMDCSIVRRKVREEDWKKHIMRINRTN